MGGHVTRFGKAEKSIDQTLHIPTGIIPRTDEAQSTHQRRSFEGHAHRHCSTHGDPNDNSWACSQPFHKLLDAAGCLRDGDLLRGPCHLAMSQDVDGNGPIPLTKKCALALPNALIGCHFVDEDEGNPLTYRFIGYFDVINSQCGQASTQD